MYVFVEQFFDPSYGDYISFHRGKTERKDSVLALEGDQIGSGFDPRMTEKLRAFVNSKRKDKNTAIKESLLSDSSSEVSHKTVASTVIFSPPINRRRRRRRGTASQQQYQIQDGGRLIEKDWEIGGERPESRMKLEAAMANLKAQQEKPLLMAELGFGLARLSSSLPAKTPQGTSNTDNRKGLSPDRPSRRSSIKTTEENSTSLVGQNSKGQPSQTPSVAGVVQDQQVEELSQQIHNIVFQGK